MTTLEAIFQAHGIEWVDVLKMDIEGGEYSALLSVVHMIGFVMVFDRMHWRRKHRWQVWGRNLMTQDESERILRILAASH